MKLKATRQHGFDPSRVVLIKAKIQYIYVYLVMGNLALSQQIIFPGKGQLRDRTETSKYDRGVTVYFQNKAWADEEFIIKWLKEQWRPAAHDPIHGFQKSQEP